MDAYLTLVIKDYLSGFLFIFDEYLDQVNVFLCISDQGLTLEKIFSGHKAILSSPTRGVVGYAITTFGMETQSSLIGFDMGATSTNVSINVGSYEQVLKTQVAVLTIQAP